VARSVAGLAILRTIMFIRDVPGGAGAGQGSALQFLPVLLHCLCEAASDPGERGWSVLDIIMPLLAILA